MSVSRQIKSPRITPKILPPRSKKSAQQKRKRKIVESETKKIRSNPKNISRHIPEIPGQPPSQDIPLILFFALSQHHKKTNGQWAYVGSNHRPRGCEPRALTTELYAHGCPNFNTYQPFVKEKNAGRPGAFQNETKKAIIATQLFLRLLQSSA